MTGTHSAKRSFNKLNKGKNNEKAYAKNSPPRSFHPFPSGFPLRESSQSAPCLTFSFFIQMFSCSIVQMFSCSIVQIFFYFFLPCSLFKCSSFEGRNENFYPYRAPHRRSDHRDSGGNAPAGFECGAGQGKSHSVFRQFQQYRQGCHDVCRRLA